MPRRRRSPRPKSDARSIRAANGTLAHPPLLSAQSPHLARHRDPRRQRHLVLRRQQGASRCGIAPHLPPAPGCGAPPESSLRLVPAALLRRPGRHRRHPDGPHRRTRLLRDPLHPPLHPGDARPSSTAGVSLDRCLRARHGLRSPRHPGLAEEYLAGPPLHLGPALRRLLRLRHPPGRGRPRPEPPTPDRTRRCLPPPGDLRHPGRGPRRRRGAQPPCARSSRLRDAGPLWFDPLGRGGGPPNRGGSDRDRDQPTPGPTRNGHRARCRRCGF